MWLTTFFRSYDLLTSRTLNVFIQIPSLVLTDISLSFAPTRLLAQEWRPSKEILDT